MSRKREIHLFELKTLRSGDVARIYVRLVIEKKKVKDFAINLALLEDEKALDVYRVDTAHGYLHEQRFWISSKPRALEYPDYNVAVLEKKKEVLENFERWVKLFKEARKRGGIDE